VSADKAAPILLFDSGVGGLTVYDALRTIMPAAPVIYAADLAGLPYGSKSEAEIAARVAGLLGRMAERYAPRLVCIACNTASTIALGMVRDVLEIPIVGTVPAIKPAAMATRTGVIGLIGTEATIRQRYVDDLEARFAGGKTLMRIAAPELVAAAEAKLRGEPVDRAAIDRAAAGLSAMGSSAMGVDGRMDTLVLACTHFPLLAEELAEAFGRDISLIDGADGIARRIASLLDNEAPGSLPADRAVANRFIVTGPISAARGLEPALKQRGFTPAEMF